MRLVHLLENADFENDRLPLIEFAFLDLATASGLLVVCPLQRYQFMSQSPAGM
jgi:hypothetical protein